MDRRGSSDDGLTQNLGELLRASLPELLEPRPSAEEAAQEMTGPLDGIGPLTYMALEADVPEEQITEALAGLAAAYEPPLPGPLERLAAELTESGHTHGWLPPGYELVWDTTPLEIPPLQIERGGLTFPQPGVPLTPEQQARHDRMKRWEQERWAEWWLTLPVLDALSWYCARCRFTGPAAEHPACGNTQLERVRVTVSRYFPPEDDDDGE